MTKLLWIDTETTGTDPEKHAVVQIAGIVDYDGKVQEEFEFFCRPHEGAIITEKALEIIGRTKEEIMAFPPAYEAYSKLRQLLYRYVPKYTKDVNQRCKIAGQNIGFDYGMMESFFKRCGDQYWYASIDRRGIDLIQASVLFRLADKLPVTEHKLEAIASALGVDLVAHNAMNDIRATRECYYRLVDILKAAPLPVRA